MLTTPSDLMPPLLAACPSFEPAWTALLEEWRDADEPPVYIALGDLVRHLAHLLGAGDVDAVRRVLDTVEALLQEATDDARQALIVGIIEDLQNERLYPAGTRPADMLPLLGPISRSWWDEVARFWLGEVPVIGAGYQPPQ